MENKKKILIEKIDESLQSCEEGLTPSFYIEEALNAYQCFVEAGFRNTEIDTIMRIAQYKLLCEGIYYIKEQLQIIQETLEEFEKHD